MIPPLMSLVKYDNPVLVSSSKDKKGAAKGKGGPGGKVPSPPSLNLFRVGEGGSGPAGSSCGAVPGLALAGRRQAGPSRPAASAGSALPSARRFAAPSFFD